MLSSRAAQTARDLAVVSNPTKQGFVVHESSALIVRELACVIFEL